MYFHPKLAWPSATYDVISRNHSNWPSLNLSQNVCQGWMNGYWKRYVLMFYPLGKKLRKTLWGGGGGRGKRRGIYPHKRAGSAHIFFSSQKLCCVNKKAVRPYPALAEISLCATENLASRPAFSYEPQRHYKKTKYEASHAITPYKSYHHHHRHHHHHHHHQHHHHYHHHHDHHHHHHHHHHHLLLLLLLLYFVLGIFVLYRVVALVFWCFIAFIFSKKKTVLFWCRY